MEDILGRRDCGGEHCGFLGGVVKDSAVSAGRIVRDFCLRPKDIWLSSTGNLLVVGWDELEIPETIPSPGMELESGGRDVLRIDQLPLEGGVLVSFITETNA